MEHISDAVETFFKSASPHNIIKSFQMAGISLIGEEACNIFAIVTPDTAVLARPPTDQEHGDERRLRMAVGISS
jgi:hypothetical protein